MKKWMHVYVDTSDDALFGSEGPADYDANDSRKAFVNAVESRLAAVLPDYDSDVVEVAHAKRAVVSDDNEDAEAAAEAIVAEIYGSFEWLVESE